MSNSPPSNSNESPSLPPPPPPPPQNPQGKISLFVMKRTTPPDVFFHALLQKSTTPPPAGPYFFYGSLLDPCMLVEILNLHRQPEPRPAQVKGYDYKLCEQYPALVPGQGDSLVGGDTHEVQTVGDAEKLAAYETAHYTPQPCLIEYTDGKAPTQQLGYTFVFTGNARDLSDGTFDLKVWLRRMGRDFALDKLEANHK